MSQGAAEGTENIIVTNGEALILLQNTEQRAVQTGTNSKLPHRHFFLSAKDYLKRFSVYTTPATCEDLRAELAGKPVTEDGQTLTAYEFSSIANLVPSNAEEARKLIGTLDRIPDDELEAVLLKFRSYIRL